MCIDHVWFRADGAVVVLSVGFGGFDGFVRQPITWASHSANLSLGSGDVIMT
jgi:hypothetical protein